MHLWAGDAVDEKFRGSGGAEGEEEVVALAYPGCALLQLLGSEGGGDRILQGRTMGVGQGYQLWSCHFLRGEAGPGKQG